LADAYTIRLDPGSHVIEGAAEGDRASRTVQVVAGERGRQIELEIRRTERVEMRRPVPSAVWIAGGVGLAGLAAFGVLGARGASEVHDLRATCAPHCAEGELDSATTKLIIGDVALLSGVLALSVATWLYFKRPEVAVRF
jgi:hypothetical protein